MSLVMKKDILFRANVYRSRGTTSAAATLLFLRGGQRRSCSCSRRWMRRWSVQVQVTDSLRDRCITSLIKGHGSRRSTRGLIAGLGFFNLFHNSAGSKAANTSSSKYYLIEHYLEEERLASFLNNLVDDDAVLHPISLQTKEPKVPTWVPTT
jgi:hypothetical protein